MPVKFQDYYETLGVDRSATQQQIQKAYRKLARKYHPDVSSESDSEEKFKQINEAYEVLRDSEKRKKYDRLGANWQAGQEFTPPPGFEGFEFRFGGPGRAGGGFSDFFEALFGGGSPFAGTGGFGTTRGHGDFGRSGAPFGFDRASGPSGTAAGPYRGRDQEAEIEISIQEAAQGTAKTIELEIPSSSPYGSSGLSRKNLQVRIPKGVTNGSRVRLSGQGEKGVGGGPNGDLFLRIRLRNDPRYTVDGHDLRTRVDIAPWEAALGTEIQIPTLDSSVKMKIPQGTQSGQTLRLRGKGLPRTKGAPGDLLVTVDVAIPMSLSDRERQLFEQLASESAFRPRR